LVNRPDRLTKPRCCTSTGGKASSRLLGEPAGSVDQTQMLHLHWRQSQFEVAW
jgi:hypothetical protein